jgi:hypothetical protein
MRLQIAGCDAKDLIAIILKNEVLRQPAGAASDALRSFQRMQKSV